ncbi:hypothetical protein JZ751_009601 [Albula glossodonta]|uniref:WH2 domain-containing protein n=1 Tax=Albula glossodonta TaxID=121402 RepID=A0A8T2P034_9TELE|nr:hypothetical protein JZ751_009601 [Albula glossodonta]
MFCRNTLLVCRCLRFSPPLRSWVNSWAFPRGAGPLRHVTAPEQLLACQLWEWVGPVTRERGADAELGSRMPSNELPFTLLKGSLSEVCSPRELEVSGQAELQNLSLSSLSTVSAVVIQANEAFLSCRNSFFVSYFLNVPLDQHDSRRMKARAPPPPTAPQPAPRRIFTTRNAIPDGAGAQGSEETKENVLRPSVSLLVTLPDGFQTSCTVDGSKALMDLLVDLCSQHHLNPAYHTLELLSPDSRPLAFKPNTLLGALDVHHVHIREKVAEEKVVRKPPPKVPEKTVRLVVNYHRTQKAVVRVNPLVPLGTLVPVICEKCEFDPAHVLLLQDNISNHELDLDRCLSELGIRELYALDQSLESFRSNSSSVSGAQKKGLLGLFKFNRRKTKTEEHTSEDMDFTDGRNADSSESCGNGVSAASSRQFVEARPSTLGQSQSVMNISRMSPKVELKKRRAPLPPQVQTTLSQAPGPVVGSEVTPSPPDSSQQKKRKAPAPPPTPVPSTPAEDTASELSHSTEDSEPAGSICSSNSSMEAAEPAPSTTPEEGGPAPSTTPEEGGPAPSTTPEEGGPSPSTTPEAEPAHGIPPEQKHPRSTTPEETDSALNLKLEEMENNRHSTMGAGRQVPLKPRRAPPRDPPQLEIPPPPPHPPPPTDQEPHHDQQEAAQPWLQSVDQAPGAELEAETVSVASSSGSSSCPDQGYAASEGMAEDSGVVSSPSDIAHPASPDGSISLDQGSAHPNATPKDCSSDSDEGCATWGSRHKHSGDIYHTSLSGRRQDSYEEDPELTAQLHQTLADLEADLAGVDHAERVSVSGLSVSSLDRSPHSDIPVSVVDCEVPVTTIDEVLEDYRSSMTEYEFALLSSSKTSDKSANQSYLHQPNGHTGNKNNNACTAHRQGKATEAGLQEAQGLSSTGKGPSRSHEQEKSSVTQVANAQNQENSIPGEIQTPFQNIPRGLPSIQKQPVEPTSDNEPVSPTRWQAAQSKITQSPTSRFGMKTFTVVPPKPTPIQTQKPAGSLVTGAIKIDAQGNMVKTDSSQYDSPPGPGNDSQLPLLGKAKAFWSSAEQQDTTAPSRGHAPKTRVPETSRTSPTEPPAAPSSQPPVECNGRERPEVTTRKALEGAVEQKAKLKPSSTEPKQQPVKPSWEPNQRRDLSFLKPSRRTSSQYVASAITKYTGKPAHKVESIQETNSISESSLTKQKSSDNQGFSHGAETKYTKYTRTSSETFQTTQTKPTMLVANPKRSLSFPDYSSDKSENIAELKQDTGTNTNSLDTNPPSRSFQPSNTLSQWQHSLSEQTQPSATGPDTTVPRQLNSVHSVKDGTRPEIAKKPDPLPAPGGPSDSDQMGPFGPVKKFRPVVLKTVQKETTLHSCLMEAIQMGEGKERLKKVQSEAASELERCRKTEQQTSTLSEDIPSPPFYAPPPPPFSPPPPPAPPPPSSARPKPVFALKAAGNPEQAREAMLEAIRSGSGAERLKKVPVPTKTVHVNGRLGIIQSAAPVPQEH